jgi:hypothetical protein
MRTDRTIRTSESNGGPARRRGPSGVRRSTPLLTVLACLLAVVLLGGCQQRTTAQAQGTSFTNAGEELHPVALRVHPDHAVVTVWAEGDDLHSALARSGPLATFSLPGGDYRYSVEADGHRSFESTLSLPRNRNIEVWLDAR